MVVTNVLVLVVLVLVVLVLERVVLQPSLTTIGSKLVNILVRTFAAVTYFAATLQTKSPNVWLYDSACDAYITCFKEHLLNYREFTKSESVIGFSGVEVQAQGEGEGVLVDEFGRSFVLKPILYCSDAEHPMLSMMQLQEEGGQLTFQGTNCTLVLPGGCTLYGKSINKLLHLTDFAREGKYTAVVTTRSQADRAQADQAHADQGHPEDEAENNENSNELMDAVEQSESNTPDTSLATTSNIPTRISKPKQLSPNYLWHLRLAHASTSVISKIPTIKSSFDSSSCLSCIRAKQHRLPFPKSNFKATRKLQYVHSDLSGPHILSIEEKRWYLTLMCDLTCYKWVYILPSKSSEVVFKAIEEWVAMVERESGCKVEFIRTDGGREYWGDLTPFLKKLGIRHVDTPSYTPESNGRAEWLNHVINEAA